MDQTTGSWKTLVNSREFWPQLDIVCTFPNAVDPDGAERGVEDLHHFLSHNCCHTHASQMEGAEIVYQSPAASTSSVLLHVRSLLKRYRGSPTGQTPTQPRKKVPARLVYSARKKLDFSTA